MTWGFGQREFNATCLPWTLPAWDVEVRTARDGDRRVAYPVNRMRVPVKVTLPGRAGVVRLRDLRTGVKVAGQMTLAPRQLMYVTC